MPSRSSRSSAAYWLGDQKQESLQRLYGTAWPSKDELKGYLDFLSEAEKRDHPQAWHRIGSIQLPEEVGSGLAVFHPKGGVVRKVMEDYSRKRHEEGDMNLSTPRISRSRHYLKSLVTLIGTQRACIQRCILMRSITTMER